MAEKMKFIDIDFPKILHITERAVLVAVTEDEEEKLWIPRSTLSKLSDESIRRGMEDVTLQIHDWFVDKQGLR